MSLLDETEAEKSQPEESIPPTAGPTVTRRGDIWQLGRHRVLCGDARDAIAYTRLMRDERAAMTFADPPFNVRVRGHVQGRGQRKHAEFAFASGEMSDTEYRTFLCETLGAAANASRDGAVVYVCIDWRHVGSLIAVGRKVYGAMLNLVVWNKTNAGQGSFYRSQHELICVFRVGDGAHQNNIELGRHGRNRSNVWTYPGVSSFGGGREDALAHPTPKPVALVADAMRDCTSQGDLVLDPFLGSGTTIMAAEKVGRRGYGIEYEAGYVDVIVRRWQAYTHADAVLVGDGRTFDEIAAERVKAPEPHIPTPAKELAAPKDELAGADWVRLCDPAFVEENDG
jgi:DNA modification methylase